MPNWGHMIGEVAMFLPRTVAHATVAVGHSVAQLGRTMTMQGHNADLAAERYAATKGKIWGESVIIGKGKLSDKAKGGLDFTP